MKPEKKSGRERLFQTRSSHVMVPNRLDIPINEYSFCDNEVKEVLEMRREKKERKTAVELKQCQAA